MIKEFENGLYIVLPEGVRLLNRVLDKLDKIKEELGFEEVILPKIVRVETLEKSKVLGKWDDYLLSVKPFSSTKGVTEEYIMDPLQCTSFYQFFENCNVDLIKWYDKSGPTYRNEDLDKIKAGIKQREFHRAEFMYLGSEKEVNSLRDEFVRKLSLLFVRLGLKIRIVDGDSCYHGKLSKNAVKDIEVLVNGEWLEIAGCSVLGSLMTKRFNINNGLAFSGCVGIGLNRLIYALKWGR